MKARMTGFLVLVLVCAGTHPHAATMAWGPPAAMAQPAGGALETKDDVAEAQTLYDQGKFSEGADVIREGLSSGRVFGTRAVRARELLARCQVKMADIAAAKRTFLTMLRQDPLYRPDALRIPPDEVGAFNLALRDFEAEQARSESRIPASIELHYGFGSGANTDFGEVVEVGGGNAEYDNDPHFGGIVRFPIAARISVDIQIERFHATNADSFPGTSNSTYEISAIPVSVSLAYLLMNAEKYRVSAFVGGGPMLEATSSISLPFFSVKLQVADDKVGTYAHAGLEGEYLVSPRFSVTGRVLGRYAKATGLFKDTDFEPYMTGNAIANRDIDFSGFAATIGLRAYVGY
jgi:hypothetical protein